MPGRGQAGTLDVTLPWKNGKKDSALEANRKEIENLKEALQKKSKRVSLLETRCDSLQEKVTSLEGVFAESKQVLGRLYLMCKQEHSSPKEMEDEIDRETDTWHAIFSYGQNKRKVRGVARALQSPSSI